jgi:hypothetical protein
MGRITIFLIAASMAILSDLIVNIIFRNIGGLGDDTILVLGAGVNASVLGGVYGFLIGRYKKSGNRDIRDSVGKRGS